MKVSERRICRVLGQHRSTQRYEPQGREDEDRLVADMIELARQYGSYGYRRVAALLREAGWQVSIGRVERLWKREGLKVPPKHVRRQGFWDRWAPELREDLAYLIHMIMRRICGEASAGFRWSLV